MAVARKIATLPAMGEGKHLVLFSNGGISPRNGAVQPELTYLFQAEGIWGAARDGFVDFTVLNQSDSLGKPSGYVLTAFGSIMTFGTSVTYPKFYGAQFTEITGDYRYVAFAMEPGGEGGGTILDCFGIARGFGDIASPTLVNSGWPINGNRGFGFNIARDWSVDWYTQRYVILDGWGGVHNNFGASLPSDGYFKGQDVFRSIHFDFETMTGYKLDARGVAYGINTDEILRGIPWSPLRTVGRDLVIEDFETEAARKFYYLTDDGVSLYGTSSLPPEAMIVEPAGVNEVQKVTFGGTITGGTFKVVFNGNQSSAINWNETNDDIIRVKLAPAFVPTNTQVTFAQGANVSPKRPFQLEFVGRSGAINQNQITIVNNLTGTSPTATPSTITAGAAATLTTSRFINTIWSYTDAENDAQNSYEVQIWPRPGGSFPSEWATQPPGWAIYGSGPVYYRLFKGTGKSKSVRSLKSDVPASNGTYRVFLRVQELNGFWSAWTYRDVTVNVIPPTEPTATIIPNVSQGTVSIEIPTGDYLSTDMIHVCRRFPLTTEETEQDWTLIPVGRNGGVFPVTDSEAGILTIIDYEFPAGIKQDYVIRATNADGSIPSDWVEYEDIYLKPVGWWLKDPSDPSLNIRIAREDDDFSITIQESDEVVHIPGRREAVVISTEGGGDNIDSFTIVFDHDDIWEKFEKMYSSKRTLLLQAPHGRQWYCRLFGLQHKFLQANMTTGQRLRTASMSGVEVARP